MFMIKCRNFNLFSTWALLIRVHLKRLPSRNVEVPHTRCTCPFRFSWEIDVTASKLDIPPAHNIWSVFNGAHLPWYYTSVGPLALALHTVFFYSNWSLAFSKSSTTITTTTMGMSKSIHLADDLFDFHVLSSMKRLAKSRGDWSASSKIAPLLLLQPFAVNISKLGRIDKDK